MNYKLIRGKRRSLSVTVADGEVTVKAPQKMPLAHIEAFLAEKERWIEKKLAEQNKKNELLAPLKDGTHVMYHGRLYAVVPDGNRRVHFEGDRLIVPDRPTTEARQASITAWFKKLAKDELCEALDCMSAVTGLRHADFAITNARTKWGSCDGNCNIRLNWRLVMLEPELTEYVIVHELCHTLNHDHSAAFWANVQRFLPEYKKLKKRLKTFSPLTGLYR